MKDKVEIGKAIQKARKRKNLTQQELASLIKVSDKAVSNWETGKNYPDYAYLNDLSEILEIEFRPVQNKNLKYIKIFLYVIIAILIVLSTIYFLNNYNKYNLYEINTDSKEFYIKNSYIMETPNNLVISLGEIINANELIQPNYRIKLIYKDNNKSKEIIDITNYKTLTINIDDPIIKRNIKQLYLIIQEDSKKQEIKLNLKIIDSNSRLFNKKTSTKKIDISQENLLANNGYQSIGNNVYYKDNGTEKFIFDSKNELLIYSQNTKESLYKAEFSTKKDEKILKRYIYLRDNKIIEEYDGKTYTPEIHTKYKELHKLLNEEYEKITS